MVVIKGGGMSQKQEPHERKSTVNCNKTTQHGEIGGERLGQRLNARNGEGGGRL